MEQRGGLPLLLLLLIWWSAHAALPASSQTSWRPIVPAQLSTSIVHRTNHGGSPSYRYNLHEPEEPNQQLAGAVQNRDECSLYKVAFGQQLYFEYIHYKIDVPELKEFTLCVWTKFTNHTNDHPLFSYAVGDQPRSILSWIANTQRSSYYMMNIDGHNLYRLNYPLRLNRWYHSCQSWNGRTGEWQIWVNDERVGRGFNNRLVGHVIKGGGVAISGQEQRQLGGGFLEGEGAPPGSGGMLGEITMLQLYGVALTAGKAHRDHKHHHAHHFEHDTSNNVPPATTTQAPVTGPPLPMHPFLTGGQLNHQVKINPGAHIQIIQNGVTLRHPALPPHPAMAPQPLPPAIYPEPSTSASPLFPQPQQQQHAVLPYSFAKTLAGIGARAGAGGYQDDDGTPVNGYSFVDRRYREAKSADAAQDAAAAAAHDELNDEIQKMADQVEIKKIKRESPADSATDKADKKVQFILQVSDTKKEDEATRDKRSSSSSASATANSSDRKTKRGLIFPDGSIVGDSYIQQQQPAAQQLDGFSTDFFGGGLASFGLNQLRHKHKDNKEDEREPAEDEVRRVMNICDGCADEPFEKALVMAWRNVPKKLYSGALHVPAVQACKAF